ncbi:hypothetical protein HDU67_006387 [Dinochytrium kinnereticum]|nr:hypothetical protein HDU67_006387 [Dinochytrium kinnereticum]
MRQGLRQAKVVSPPASLVPVEKEKGSGTDGGGAGEVLEKDVEKDGDGGKTATKSPTNAMLPLSGAPSPLKSEDTTSIRKNDTKPKGSYFPLIANACSSLTDASAPPEDDPTFPQDPHSKKKPSQKHPPSKPPTILTHPDFHRELTNRHQKWKEWLETEFKERHSSVKAASDVLKSHGHPDFTGFGIVIIMASVHPMENGEKPTGKTKPKGLADPLSYMNLTLTLLHEKFRSNIPVEVWTFKRTLSASMRSRISSLSTVDRPVVLRFADDPRNYASIEVEHDDDVEFQPFRFPLSSSLTPRDPFGSTRTKSPSKSKKDVLEGPRLSVKQRLREMAELVKVAAAVNAGFERFLVVEDTVAFVRNPEMLAETFEEGRGVVYGDEDRERGKPAAVFWPSIWKVHSKSLCGLGGLPCRDEWDQLRERAKNNNSPTPLFVGIQDPSIMLINKELSWKALMLAWHLTADLPSRQFRRILTHSPLHRLTHLATSTPYHPIQHVPTPAGFMLTSSTKKPPSFCGVATVQSDVRGRPVAIDLAGGIEEMDLRDFYLGNPVVAVLKRYLPAYRMEAWEDFRLPSPPPSEVKQTLESIDSTLDGDAKSKGLKFGGVDKAGLPIPRKDGKPKSSGSGSLDNAVSKENVDGKNPGLEDADKESPLTPKEDASKASGSGDRAAPPIPQDDIKAKNSGSIKEGKLDAEVEVSPEVESADNITSEKPGSETADSPAKVNVGLEVDVGEVKRPSKGKVSSDQVEKGLADESANMKAEEIRSDRKLDGSFDATVKESLGDGTTGEKGSKGNEFGEKGKGSEKKSGAVRDGAIKVGLDAQEEYESSSTKAKKESEASVKEKTGGSSSLDVKNESTPPKKMKFIEAENELGAGELKFVGAKDEKGGKEPKVDPTLERTGREVGQNENARFPAIDAPVIEKLNSTKARPETIERAVARRWAHPDPLPPPITSPPKRPKIPETPPEIIEEWYVTRNNRLPERPGSPDDASPGSLLSYGASIGFGVERTVKVGRPYGPSAGPLGTFKCMDLIDRRHVDALVNDASSVHGSSTSKDTPLLAVRFETEVFSLSANDADDDYGVDIQKDDAEDRSGAKGPFPFLKAVGIPEGLPRIIFKHVFAGEAVRQRKEWEEMEAKRSFGSLALVIFLLTVLPLGIGICWLLVYRCFLRNGAGVGENGGFMVKKGDRLRYKVYKSLKGNTKAFEVFGLLCI